MGESNEANHKEGTHAGSLQNVQEVRKAGVSPHAPVKIEKIEDQNLDDQDHGEKSNQDGKLALRDGKVEAQEIGKIPGYGKKDDIDSQDNEGIQVGGFLGHFGLATP